MGCVSCFSRGKTTRRLLETLWNWVGTAKPSSISFPEWACRAFSFCIDATLQSDSCVFVFVFLKQGPQRVSRIQPTASLGNAPSGVLSSARGTLPLRTPVAWANPRQSWASAALKAGRNHLGNSLLEDSRELEHPGNLSRQGQGSCPQHRLPWHTP